jgi:CDP-6-deoxy-D-xylo-4-hexulose-3-dehydrase
MLSSGLPLASSTWDENDLSAAKEVLDSGNITMGEKVAEFEKRFAQELGSKHAVMFNSGSSANLAIMFGLKYSKISSLKPGAEIIVPAVSWSTTFYPVCQAGFKLRFVDIDPDSLNLSLEEVVKSINKNTGAILAVNLLGNPANLEELATIADSNDLLLIEDNCESLGASINGKKAGTFGLAGSFSFYFSHHICTMEGGMVVTDSQEFEEVLKSLRAHGWTRGLRSDNQVYPLSSNPWDDLFRFVLPGFNLRPVEISGAVGITQMNKLESLITARRSNAAKFVELFCNSTSYRIQKEMGKSSWFGFSIVLKNGLKGRRAELIDLLSHRGFETRPIVAGNFLRNPVMKHLDYIAEGNFSNADDVHENGFFVGNHHYDIETNLTELHEILMEFSGEVVI